MVVYPEAPVNKEKHGDMEIQYPQHCSWTINEDLYLTTWQKSVLCG